MAELTIRKAVQNGNWSDTSTWYGGLKPSIGDVVATNGFDLILDEDINVYHITNQTIPETKTLATSKALANNVQAEGDEGVVVGSGSYSQYFYVFDQGTSAVRFYVGSWSAYKFNEPKVIDKYKFFQNYSAGHSRNVDGFTIDASNDGVNWVNLDTVNNVLNTTEYENLSLSNTTAYTYYRIYITAVGSYGSGYVRELYLWEQDTQVISVDTEGGSLTLFDGVTVTCTDPKLGITNRGNITDFITYNGSTSATVNANWMENTSSSSGRKATFAHNGTGTLNIVGECRDRYPYMNTDLSTVAVYYIERYGYRLKCNGEGTTNIVGNFHYSHNGYGSERYYAFNIQGGHTLNITGDYVWDSDNPGGSQNARSGFIDIIDSTFNMTGSIDMRSDSRSGTYPFLFTRSEVSITGDITSNFEPANNSSYANHYPYIYVNTGTTANIIGKIETNTRYYAIRNAAGYLAPLVMSGPFVCGQYGELPFYSDSIRIHSDGVNNNSFVFRDDTNTYSTYPSPEPNPVTFYTADSIVELPLQSDVRLGTNYGNNNYTGTLAVPNPNQVSYGVATDNTVGTAVLTPDDVWNAQTSAMNTDGSIGKRLKNSSTVDSTGDQLSSLL